MNGYLSAMLRTYYPLEFTTSYLNNAEDKKDINNGVELARFCGIKINPIQFGKSRARYTMERETNSIYKGIDSIKYCNKIIAEELYELAQSKQYDNFVDLLKDIHEKTSTDARQLKILITLGFFSMFGKNRTLLDISEMYDLLGTKKQIKKCDIEKLNIKENVLKDFAGKETEKLYKELDMTGYIKQVTSNIEQKVMSIQEQIKAEIEYLEYAVFEDSRYQNIYIVTEYKTYKDPRKPYFVLYHLGDGEQIKTKVNSVKTFAESPFNKFSVMKIPRFKEQYKRKKIKDEWVITDEVEKITTEWEVLIP